jgi:hypothetical protein
MIGPPGAPVTWTPGLLHGVYGLMTLSGIATLHLYNCRIRVEQSLADVTGHGDEWEQMVALRQRFSGTATGYLSRSAAATATYIGGAHKISASPGEMTVHVYSDFGTTEIFTGTVFSEDVTISFPNAMVEQEITFRGNAAPTLGPAA